MIGLSPRRAANCGAVLSLRGEGWRTIAFTVVGQVRGSQGTGVPRVSSDVLSSTNGRRKGDKRRDRRRRARDGHPLMEKRKETINIGTGAGDRKEEVLKM